MLTVPRPSASPAIIDSMLAATVGAWGTLTDSTRDYWSAALTRGMTPFSVAKDLRDWHAAINNRSKPEWAHPHTIVKEWPIARLRDYSAPDAEPGMIATVILPPQAGHDSSIVDYDLGQSQIMVGRESGCSRIYSLDWIGATQATKHTGVEDYITVLLEVADAVGGRFNLVGDCQGGWLATIFAALHPEKVASLTVAGAPIDFHAGDALIRDWLQVLAPAHDMTFFRSAVDANDGVLPGRFLLDGFKALQPDSEFSRTVQLLANVRDPEHVERYRKFENWFQWTQALPGAFYLWAVEHLFSRNSLIAGELVVGGQKVDLGAISCPVFLLAGETDHITPAEQVWALAEHVSTPRRLVHKELAASGHLGLFMSRDALATRWPIVFKKIADLSGRASATAIRPKTSSPVGSAEQAPKAPPKSAGRKAAVRQVASKADAPGKSPVATASVEPPSDKAAPFDKAASSKPAAPNASKRPNTPS